MKKRPLVIVEWDDITTNTGWKREDLDCSPKIAHCKSVGWKIKSDHKNIVITPMRDSEGYCDDRQIIPKGCIRNIRRIE